MAAVGVGDEDLTELLAGNEGDNLFHAAGVELVEDVVEQQDRGVAAVGATEKVELCQLQGYDEGLVLSLTALAAYGVAAKGEDEVVAVDAVQRIAHDAVFGPVALDDLEEWATLAMGDVFDGHLLAVA